ncbi:MAG TPA: hypothetical protein VGD60_11415 [Candidatus Acidoferrales bacterium]
MTPLEIWLQQATQDLSKDSSVQVRAEIQEHFESAREAQLAQGASAADADRLALAALGAARTANCQYRKVLLTSAEARLLRQSNWEARAVCALPWLKRILMTVPAIPLVTGAVLFFYGSTSAARFALLASLTLALFFAAPFFAVYTPSRGRIYRIAKWTAFAGLIALAFGPDALKYSWLLASCLWVPVWTETTRASIRRKLPVAQWPRQLYL